MITNKEAFFQGLFLGIPLGVAIVFAVIAIMQVLK